MSRPRTTTGVLGLVIASLLAALVCQFATPSGISATASSARSAPAVTYRVDVPVSVVEPRDSTSSTRTTPAADSLTDAFRVRLSLRTSPGVVRLVSGYRLAAKEGADVAFHYTRSEVAALIEKNGLRPGSYLTKDGRLSSLQAQLDLALPPNRGLSDALIRVDLAGLRKAGYDIDDFTRVGRKYNMPGRGHRVAVHEGDSVSICEGRPAMTPDEIRERMEMLWAAGNRAADELRDPFITIERVTSFYVGLDARARATADQVLAGWVLSLDEAKRFDAIALVRELVVRAGCTRPPQAHDEARIE